MSPRRSYPPLTCANEPANRGPYSTSPALVTLYQNFCISRAAAQRSRPLEPVCPVAGFSALVHDGIDNDLVSCFSIDDGIWKFIA